MLWRVLLNQRIGPEFLAQSAAVNAQYTGRLTLVALRVIHYRLEQRSFHFTDDEIVQVARPIPVQRREILIQCVFSVFAEWFLAVFRLQRVVLLFVVYHGHQILNRWPVIGPYETPPSFRSK